MLEGNPFSALQFRQERPALVRIWRTDGVHWVWRQLLLIVDVLRRVREPGAVVCAHPGEVYFVSGETTLVKLGQDTGE